MLGPASFWDQDIANHWTRWLIYPKSENIQNEKYGLFPLLQTDRNNTVPFCLSNQKFCWLKIDHQRLVPKLLLGLDALFVVILQFVSIYGKWYLKLASLSDID